MNVTHTSAREVDGARALCQRTSNVHLHAGGLEH